MAAKIPKHETDKEIHFLKSHSKKFEASSIDNIDWIGFYRLIKLRFWMGQNAGYFNKANQRYSFFYSINQSIFIPPKIKRIILSYIRSWNSKNT